MSGKVNRSGSIPKQCGLVEQLIYKKATLTPEELEALTPEEIQLVIHELRVHQIELEMQNDELRRIQAELNAARSRYFDLYDLAPVGYCTISKKGLFQEANLAAAILLGIKRGTLAGQPISRFILKEDQDIYYLLRKKLFETGQPQTCDLRMKKNDGNLFWAKLATTAVEDTENSLFRVVISDISDRKFHENELELTARLILLVNNPGNFRELMSSLTDSLKRWSGCEAVGIRLCDGDDFPYYETRGFPAEFVEAEKHLCAHSPDGEILRDSKGNPLLECMCGNILSGRFDPSKPFFTKNGSFWSNNTTALLASTSDADRQARTRNRCNGEGYESVALIPLRTGNQVFGLLQFNDHQPDRFTSSLIAHFERIADSLAIALSRHQVEEVLHKSEEKYRQYVENAPVGVFIADRQGRYQEVNLAASRITGYSVDELVTMSVSDMMPPENQTPGIESFERLLATGSDATEIPFRRKDGSIGWWSILAVRLSDDRFMGITTDITDRKQLEAQYVQAQKMEAIGQLAGGVAHDFRNQLTIIQGFASMLLDRSKVNKEDRKHVEEILKAVRRSAAITDQLLIFSRKESIHLEAVDLTESVKDMSRLLPQMVGEDIRLLIIPSPNACWVNVDPGLFQQAIINMVVNARQAMPDGGGGTLTVETDSVELDQQALRGSPNASPGTYAVVTISDTGTGMDAKTLEHIFDPFFTTKEVGKGTGMGLAMVYGFVTSSKGFIQVDSEPDRGSTFRLYFPLVQPAEASTVEEAIHEPGILPEGSETILVVEDEEALRQLAVSMLRECGYRVLEAANAAEALPLGEHYEGQIDLLATDVIMPNMMGTELAERLRIARPDMPVLFLSGYSQNLADDKYLQNPGTELLVKPFDFAALAQAVRRLLDLKK